jgi:hypothetical protein
MSALLMNTVIALGIGQLAGAADGRWTIVYAEEGGRRNNAWEQRLAVCKDGMLSYEDAGGKKLSLALKFGAHHALDATVNEGGPAGKAWHGVYILGQDYLCLSLNKGARKAGGGTSTGTSGGGSTTATAGGGTEGGSDFILILRRMRAGKGGQ